MFEYQLAMVIAFMFYAVTGMWQIGLGALAFELVGIALIKVAGGVCEWITR